MEQSQEVMIDGALLGLRALWEHLVVGFPDLAAEQPILWAIPGLAVLAVIAGAVKVARF